MKDRPNMLILAECCANHYIAKRMLDMLNEVFSFKAKLRHNFRQGRDRILSNIERIIKESENYRIFAVIDFEKGEVARKYINAYFILHKIDDRILLGVSKKYSNKVTAIIFDPNIEEAFLCPILREICSDRSKFDLVKSSKCEDYLSKVIDRNSLFQEKLQKIVNELITRI